MTTLLTTAGATHLTELDAGTTPTNSFDALVFSQDNETPTVTDTQAQLTGIMSIIRRVESGYPVLNDTSDARNPGAGASWWTWKFVLPAGTPFVASNLAVTNYAGATFDPSTALMVHSDDGPFAQRYDERLVVFVNAQTGQDPTIYTATETSLENRIGRVVGFVARSRALGSFPSGGNIGVDVVRTRPQPGQYVWTAAYQPGPNGQTLTPERVEWFRLIVEEYDATTKAHTEFQVLPLTPSVHVFGVPQYGDQRWNEQGGYNVAHAWTPPSATEESTWRLTYEMKLDDGDMRRWTNIVEVRRGAR